MANVEVLKINRSKKEYVKDIVTDEIPLTVRLNGKKILANERVI